MKETLDSSLRKRVPRLAIKILLGLLAASLSTFFFGICVPFLLLALKILPSLGVAGVVYVFAGGLAGLLLGGIGSAYSLARSPRLIPRSYAILIAGLCAALLAFWALYSMLPEWFAHI